MMRTLRCLHRADLPEISADDDLVALNATVDGELVAVSAPYGPRNQLSGRRATIHVHQADGGWRTISPAGLTIDPSRVDLLPGTGFLLAQSRTVKPAFGPVRDNAQVFDDSGRSLRSFRLGDGIRELAVDEPGTIWAGYFDEGIYSGDPLSAGGITRFDEYGRKLWTYWPPPEFDHIADCYALNVGARTTWACYYTGFPLVRIDDTRIRPVRSGPVTGARAVLVDGDAVVFVGGYGKPFDLTECRIGGDTVVAYGPAELVDTGGRPLGEFRVISTRGSRLFVRADQRILEADLADG